MEEILKKIESILKDMFRGESSGHDIYHLKRVLNLALKLQEKEGGDKIVIAVSAFLHDIHRIMEKEQKRFVSPKDSLIKIKEILNKVNLPEHQKNGILHCVEFHDEYGFSETGKTVNDIETLIVQDADNLDAIGAIGIGRTFTFGGAHNLGMWLPELPFNRLHFDESEKDPSAIHHFYSKLLKLKDNMNTKTAKQMANARHKFMELFLKEFFSEWNGEK